MMERWKRVSLYVGTIMGRKKKKKARCKDVEGRPSGRGVCRRKVAWSGLVVRKARDMKL